MINKMGAFGHPISTAKQGYFILVLVYLAGIAAPINQFKVPPMMQKLIAELDISLTASGWLMSAFALAGFVFALPSGVLLQRVGVKKLGVIALGVMLIGSIIGGAVTSAPIILISRVLEGIGMSLFSVTAPAAISAWFPPEKRGIPMGVWATWVPAGNVVIFALAPFIGIPGWRNVWIFSSAYTAVMLIMFLGLFRMPAVFSGTSVRNNKLLWSAFGVWKVWILAIIFTLFNVVTISIKSYLPVFLESVRGFSPVTASGVIVIMMICSMATAPVSGVISDRIHSRKKLVLMACFLAIFAVWMMFSASGIYVIISLVLMGIAGGAMPVGIFTAVTELADNPEKSGAYMSVVVFGQYLGMFLGPVLFSFAADNFGWLTASYVLVIIATTVLFITAKNSEQKLPCDSRQ